MTKEENLARLENLDHYKLIEDEKELRWFFDHCVRPPKINEAYAFCLSIRKKKLDKEDLASPLGRVEMLDPQVVMPNKEGVLTYEKWKSGIRAYECHKEAFIYGGRTLPAKAMVCYYHINPCDELKAIKDLKSYIAVHEQELIDSSIKDLDRANFIANILGPDLSEYLSSPDKEHLGEIQARIGSLKTNTGNSGTAQSIYKMCKSLSKLKRLQFDNIGTKYWVDFDLDLSDSGKQVRDLLYNSWYTYCLEKLGKGNFVVIQTSGGYHTMVNKEVIKWNPNQFIKDFEELSSVVEGSKNSMFIKELEYNTNSMIPVPGTFQYGEVVTVMNKGDFQ